MSLRYEAPIDHDPDNETAVDAPIDIRMPLDTMPASTFSSSNVHSALYDFGEMRLFVRYLRDGPDAIYQYFQVPATVWKGLFEADSKGSFINEYVAYQYRYAKAGRDDFPSRGHGLENDLARRFVLDP